MTTVSSPATPVAGTPPVAMSEPRTRRAPLLPLAFVAVFASLTLCPRIGDSDALLRTFGVAGGVLFVWAAILWFTHRGRANAFGLQIPGLMKTHVVQSCVQTLIYAYWAYHWPEVASQSPLFLAQVLFLACFDALLSWTRGRAWRLGMGQIPIVLSTNIFLWFRDDWFLWQFALMAVIALGKEFIKWERDGRVRHIFNPSAFALALFSLVLIVTGNTEKTWAAEIATTIFRPHFIYLQIFLLGLVVQYLFGTVLMTLSAATVLYLINVVYTANTGLYYFIDSNISAAVFLGFHLLVTDPSTSPRSNLGKVLFGGGYGAAIALLYVVLGEVDAPQLYDKLLPIPILNLSVRFLDRLTNAGPVGRFTRWEAGLPRARMNLVYMACWTALFTTMYVTGFVEAPHPGRRAAFWREAQVAGKPGAGEKLLHLVSTRAAKGHSTSLDQLGVMIMDGDLLERDVALAAQYFAMACEGGSARGCLHVLTLVNQGGPARTEEDVERAFAFLEARLEGADPQPVVDRDFSNADDEPDADILRFTDGEAAYLLGLAYETGRGRKPNEERTVHFHSLGARFGNLDAAKGVARNVLSDFARPEDVHTALDMLRPVAASGDAPACVLLAYALDVAPQYAVEGDASVTELLQRACDAGNADACTALENRAADGSGESTDAGG